MRATDVMMIFVTLGVLWNSGCGARAAADQTTAPAAPQAPEEASAQMETTDEIAMLQAQIEEQRGIVAGLTECIDRCRASESICDSAGRICNIARDLAEREAIESCRRAESTCDEARGRVDEECDCAP